MSLTSIETPRQAVPPYFQHSLLDLHKKQIRLFAILPELVLSKSSRNQAPRHLLACLVEHHDLIVAETDDPDSHCNVPDYIAVSYAWGTEVELHHILVNGSLFKVRSNLHDFLREMHGRGNKFDTSFWVDQLCIDQENGTERNHQVSMMSSIYQDAHIVYAWLGTATPRTHAAGTMLKELESIVVEYWNQIKATDDHSVKDELQKALEDLFLSMVDWTILADILGRPYWSRLWIVQELVLAKQIVVHCGPVEWSLPNDINDDDGVAMTLFETLDEDMHAKRLRDYDTENALQLLIHCANFLNRYMEFDHLLAFHSNRKCCNPRDKIYGLQACAEPNQRIPVNYSWSVEYLFLVVAEDLRLRSGPTGWDGYFHELLPQLRDEMGLKWWTDDDLVSLIEDPHFRVKKGTEE